MTYLFAVVWGTLICFAVGGVPWTWRRSSGCDDNWTDPCKQFHTKSRSREESIRSFCRLAPNLFKCMNDSLDTYFSRAEACMQRTPFSEPRATVRTMMKEYRAGVRVICALPIAEASGLIRCVASQKQSMEQCAIEAAENHGFTPADIYRKTEGTPTVETFCGFMDDAYECTVNTIVSECGQISLEFAQVTGNVTIRWPFDYDNICSTSQDLSEQLGFHLNLERQAATMQRRQENDVLAILLDTL